MKANKVYLSRLKRGFKDKEVKESEIQRLWNEVCFKNTILCCDENNPCTCSTSTSNKHGDHIVKLYSMERNVNDLINWINSDLSQMESGKLNKVQTPYRIEKEKFLRKAINILNR